MRRAAPRQRFEKGRMKEGASKTSLFSNDDDNVALKQRQTRVTDELRAHTIYELWQTPLWLVTVHVTLMAMIFHRLRSMMRRKSQREGIEANEKDSVFTSTIYLKINMLEEHHFFTVQYRSTIRTAYIVQSNQTCDHNWTTAYGYTRKYSQVHLRHRYYHRDRRFRFCLFNVRSMLIWVQSHKCRLKEPANNISAACERRSMLWKWVLCHSSSPSLDMKHFSSIKPV